MNKKCFLGYKGMEYRRNLELRIKEGIGTLISSQESIRKTEKESNNRTPRGLTTDLGNRLEHNSHYPVDRT